jgi:signal transduction histidine kinase/DNA-binding response OmpR family regulator
MMDNYDKDWIYAGNVNSVTYANMPPGDYLFRVKGANNDGVWNEEGVSLSIHISRPWWTSTVALCLYTLIIMTMTYLTYKRYKYQKNQKMQQMIDNIQRAEEKSLYDAKIQFLSSVSHEIKTPLSLVKAPFEQICREGPASRNYQDNMEIIGMNIDRLVNLTHQLLDFSKAENDRFLFHTSLVDISQIVTNVMSHFTGVLKDKHIEPVFDLPNEDVVCYADPEALTKIMNNLIQNASRYALHKIKISLHKENDRFVIRVLNDGEVIPSEYHDKIFNRFYQISEDSHKGGVGLGLSIVKHLTDLHHGRVYLDDTSEDTCFVVEIPFVTKAPGNGTDPDTEDNTVQEEPVDECRSERRCSTILVVEDNKDMQRFLKKMLEEKYHVYLADNGKQAFEIMDKKNVDMIISDVMMPEMDGFTLCQEIKTNLKFSHIPVILLTAKTHISAKIQGIESGANAYIEKPFSSEFLLVKIHNILSNIKLLKDAFLHSPYTLTDSIVNSVADEQFIEKINSIILDHLNDSDFSIDKLACYMNMSRSTLDRKIKDLVRLTTNDFIKLTRIKKAAQMLSEGSFRINEICYLTGFTSPSYFSKCFRKQFGIAPTELLQKREQSKS